MGLTSRQGNCSSIYVYMYMYMCLYIYMYMYIYGNVYSTLTRNGNSERGNSYIEKGEKEAVCIMYMYMYMYKLYRDAHN